MFRKTSRHLRSKRTTEVNPFCGGGVGGWVSELEDDKPQIFPV